MRNTLIVLVTEHFYDWGHFQSVSLRRLHVTLATHPPQKKLYICIYLFLYYFILVCYAACRGRMVVTDELECTVCLFTAVCGAVSRVAVNRTHDREFLFINSTHAMRMWRYVRVCRKY